MKDLHFEIEQASLLVARLERISADSIWARRASGLRGALLKWLEKQDPLENAGKNEVISTAQDSENIAFLIELSYKMLEKAAKERIR